MLGWKQSDLCAKADVSKMTLADFEAEKRNPHPRTLGAIRSALEEAGIELVEENGGGEGLRFRQRRDERRPADLGTGGQG